MSNRLETIVTRQRATRLRDVLFVVSIGIASLVSISTIGTAVDAAATKIARR